MNVFKMIIIMMVAIFDHTHIPTHTHTHTHTHALNAPNVGVVAIISQIEIVQLEDSAIMIANGFCILFSSAAAKAANISPAIAYTTFSFGEIFSTDEIVHHAACACN